LSDPFVGGSPCGVRIQPDQILPDTEPRQPSRCDHPIVGPGTRANEHPAAALFQEDAGVNHIPSGRQTNKPLNVLCELLVVKHLVESIGKTLTVQRRRLLTNLQRRLLPLKKTPVESPQIGLLLRQCGWVRRLSKYGLRDNLGSRPRRPCVKIDVQLNRHEALSTGMPGFDYLSYGSSWAVVQ
jgi:hypothetical protein